jgi:hypothetical protein
MCRPVCRPLEVPPPPQLWRLGPTDVMLLLAVLVAPGYVRLGVRPASHARSTAFARSDALPLEPLEPPELPPQQAQEAWAWDEHVQWTSGPVAPLPAEASPGTAIRLLHAAALGLMLFPPLAALLCLASYATTITLGCTLIQTLTLTLTLPLPLTRTLPLTLPLTRSRCTGGGRGSRWPRRSRG